MFRQVAIGYHLANSAWQMWQADGYDNFPAKRVITVEFVSPSEEIVSIRLQAMGRTAAVENDSPLTRRCPALRGPPCHLLLRPGWRRHREKDSLRRA